MKTLGKLKINEFVEMTDKEMKFVVGGGCGSSGSDCDSETPCEGKREYESCSYSCNGVKTGNRCLSSVFNKMYCSSS